jgi:LPS export ABC transporter protein LptC
LHPTEREELCVHISLVKHIRGFLIAIIVFVLLLVGVNYLHTWYRRAHAIKQTMQILSSEMARSAESIEYSEHENGITRFRIRAKKLLETRQGKSFLEGIEAEDFNSDGSIRNRIRSRKAEYDKDGKFAEFNEDVRVQMGEEAALWAGNLRYDLNTKIGVIKDRLQFSSKQLRGTAGGARYDNTEKHLNLDGNVDFTVVRENSTPTDSMNLENIHIISKSASYSRNTHIFRFQDEAHVDAGAATLSGESIDVALSSDEKHVNSLRCQGNAIYQAKDTTEPHTLKGDGMIFGINPASGALEKIDVVGRAEFFSSAEGRQQELQGSEIHLELDSAKALPLLVRSSTGVRFISRRDGDESIITADKLEASFMPGRNILEKLHVWDHAKMSNRIGKDAQSEDLSAEEIQIAFRDIGGRTGIQQLQADGSVQWSSNPPRKNPASAPQQGRHLSAGLLKIYYSSDGDFLESATASGNVALSEMPADEAPVSQIRRLEADTVQFHFYPQGNRPKKFEGDGHVRVIFRKPAELNSKAPAQEFRTSSNHMRADFKDADGTAKSVSQWGNFVYQESSRRATAGRCDYDAQKELLVLTEAPKIEDTNGFTTAEAMELDRKQKVLFVHRMVRSILRAKEGTPGTLPGASSSSSSATICTAEELQYWSEESHARYSGNVQMLSENGQLQARTLEIYGGGERIEARGGISHFVPQREAIGNADSEKPAKGATKANARSISSGSSILIRSSQLLYLRSKSSLLYSGNVILKSGDGDLSSDNLDVIFDTDGRQIEQATARGKVLIHQSGREAKGDTANYFLALRKFVVTGDKAEIMDPERGKSEAHRLTFFASNDRILLENR